VESF